MNILSILKKKYQKEIEQRGEDKRQRRQLNMMVDERLINETKELAAEFTVPRYCLVEHLLETGYYYVTRAMEDDDKARILRRHLINVHLVDNGIDDSEAILRIGEGGNISQLLVQVGSVLRIWEAYQYAVRRADKTRNSRDITQFLKCERKLMESVITLALWLEHHHSDELDNSGVNVQQVESDSTG